MHSADWGDIPTWVTAIATILTAIGAFVAATIAFRQLKEQREELIRQSTEQQRLAALQTKQLEQLDRQATTQRRAQAEKVTIDRLAFEVALDGYGAGPFEAVEVVNKSDRPIRDVQAWIEDSPHSFNGVHAHRLGRFDGTTDPTGPSRPVKVVRTGQIYSAVFPFKWDRFDHKGARVRFTDDAGVRWELDLDMHLIEAADSDWHQ